MAVKSALVNVMERAARKAGRALIRDFGEVEQLQVSTKGPADFVSVADLKAERILAQELAKARPDFGLLMEESGEAAAGDGSLRWVVDPLDGTTNFLHGVPHFCISIAVESLDGAGGILCGLVYDPVHDDSYWAEKGQGAFLNDRRLRVSGRRDLSTALVASGLPTFGRTDPHRHLAETEALMARVSGLRRFGAAALDLAYVAAGRYDAFWEDGLSRWDIAAGILLVREAGGFVTETGGGDRMLETGSVLAANAHLHGTVLAILAGVVPART